MQFLVDENFPASISSALNTLLQPDHTVTHVHTAGDGIAKGSPDQDVIDWCARHDAIWITRDERAVSVEIPAAVARGSGCGIVVFGQTGKTNYSRTQLLARFFGVMDDLIPLLEKLATKPGLPSVYIPPGSGKPVTFEDRARKREKRRRR